MALPAITVNGTARIRPTMPARKPPSAVTTSTTRGWMSSVRPITLGSTKFSSSRFEASTITSMMAAMPIPPSPRAMITASPPPRNAPM